MSFTKRLHSLVLILLALGLVAAKPVDESLTRVTKSGALRIAMDPSYPPMEFEGEKGAIVGFSVDFAREVAKRLGVKPQLVVMAWDGIMTGLHSGRYDVIISTMNVTPEREKQVAFVRYLEVAQVFVSKKGHEVTKEEQLSGRVVAVGADTTSANYVEERRRKDPTIKDVRAFRLAGDAIAALRVGHADVLVIDEPVGRYYVKQSNGELVVSGRAMAPEPVGVALPKEAVELQSAIAKAVEAMRADGTYKALSVTWFGQELGT